MKSRSLHRNRFTYEGFPLARLNFEAALATPVNVLSHFCLVNEQLLHGLDAALDLHIGEIVLGVFAQDLRDEVFEVDEAKLEDTVAHVLAVELDVLPGGIVVFRVGDHVLDELDGVEGGISVFVGGRGSGWLGGGGDRACDAVLDAFLAELYSLDCAYIDVDLEAIVVILVGILVIDLTEMLALGVGGEVLLHFFKVLEKLNVDG